MENNLIGEFIAIGGVVLAVLALGLLAIFVVSRRRQNMLYLKNQEQLVLFEKTLMQSRIEIQEATYTTLGNELHDNVGQLISSAKLLLVHAERAIPDPPPVLKKVQDTLSQTLQEVRSISKVLSKEWLEVFQAIPQLQIEIDRVNQNDELQVTLTAEDNVLQPIKNESQLLLYRILQEAMQNAIKHANCTSININIIAKESTIQVTIKDDGNGFDHAAASNGIGLQNIRNRVKALKGTVEWLPNNPGTNVFLTIPI